MPTRPRSDDDQFLESLRPFWKRAEQAEEPPPETLARAFALYQTHPPARRLRLPILLCVLALALLLATVSLALLAAPSVPGDMGYPFKLAAEQAEVAASWTPIARADVHLRLGANRLQEIKVLQARGASGSLHALVDAYTDQLAAVEQALSQIVDPAREPVPAATRGLLQDNIKQLDRLQRTAPRDILPALTRARARSVQLLDSPYFSPSPSEGAVAVP